MSRETPERLKSAVEELLLSKGEASTTLRDITELAGANVAAVAYHFGSKDNLISQVFAEAVDEVTSMGSKRIQDLSQDHTLEQLIDAWLHPLFLGSGSNNREALLWRIIQRGAAEKAPGLVLNMTRADSKVENTLLPLLANHLGHLGKDELLFRHNAIIGGLSGLVSSPLGTAMNNGGSDSESKSFMIAWITGGLKGPAASSI